jgi:hypothetical protein
MLKKWTHIIENSAFFMLNTMSNAFSLAPSGNMTPGQNKHAIFGGWKSARKSKILMHSPVLEVD